MPPSARDKTGQLASPERDPEPWRPEIHPLLTRRHPGGRAARRTTAGIALVGASLASLAIGIAPAAAQGPQLPGPDALVATPPAATPPPADGTTVVAPESAAMEMPAPATAGRGTYGPPEWLPLRRNVSGSEVTVGCTYDSHGAAHGYECAGHHDRWAIDFMAEPGTPVYAAGAGFATNLTGKPGGSGFGNVVRIDHGYGVSTVYAHLTVALVPPQGEWVDQDTQIGTVGSTGSASAPHLHFERFAVPSAEQSGYRDQESVDPGPLWACRGRFLVSFPQIAGFESWKGLPWGSLTVASDGARCAWPDARSGAVPSDGGADTPPGGADAAEAAAAPAPATGLVAARARRFSGDRDDPAGA